MSEPLNPEREPLGMAQLGAGMPAIPTGPIRRSPAGFATTSEREQLLRQTLADAGVTVGAYDDVIVRWAASTPDWPTFAVLASWIRQAAKGAAR